MSVQDVIREKMQSLIEYYVQNPDKAAGPDKEAVAVVEEGLRVRATGPDGQTLLCDMPRGLGGSAMAPSPGWMLRAALANCEAIMIALRAAQLGVPLDTLEVRVQSASDDRGLLGMDDSKPAGPRDMQMSIRIGSAGVPETALHEIIDWAEHHSPLGEALRRATPVALAVEVV